MGLPLGSPVAKLSCEAATEENAKRRSFMPRTQVTGKVDLSGGDTDTWYKLASSNETDRRNTLPHHSFASFGC